MGRSISHYKLETKAIDFGHYILIDGWEEECNVPLSVYEPYIMDVKTYDFNVDIGIFTTEAEAEKRLQLNDGKTEFEKVFVGDLEEYLIAQINQYIKVKKYQHLERLDLEIEANGILHHSISFGTPCYKKGFYFSEVGYQKGEMINSFWEEFAGFAYYGKKTDFERAFKFLNTEWAKGVGGNELAQTLVENFKANFLESFEYMAGL